MKSINFKKYVLRNSLRLFLISLFICVSIVSQAQNLRKVFNESYTYGEKISYRVYYDAILTGKV
ncbi:MAG: hypothetical protein GX587_10045, partial [Bacteroidales bacterium]|nr:hypothetical protein [Bacteroidales bacterium]